MQYPEEKLDRCGKRLQGIGEQPDGSSHQEILGCELNRSDNYEKYKFSVNHCENHMKSDLDTISLKINRDSKEVKFLIETGAEISLIEEASLNSEAGYKLREGAKIKGIGNAVLKTDGIVKLKLHRET